MKTLRLGLIGGNITETRSPALQIVCGLSVGRNVTYDLLIPAEQGLSFAEMLARCQSAGLRRRECHLSLQGRSDEAGAAGRSRGDGLGRRKHHSLHRPMARLPSTPTTPASSPPIAHAGARSRRAACC